MSVPEEINVNPIEKMDVDEAPIDKNDEMNHMDVDNFVMLIYCYLIKIKMINKRYITFLIVKSYQITIYKHDKLLQIINQDTEKKIIIKIYILNDKQ